MKKVKLGEVLSLKKGKKATVLAEQTTLSKRYIQIDDLRNNNNLKFTESLNMTEALPDDILIAWDGANAGTVGYGLSGAVGSTIMVLKKNERYKEKIISDYLGVFLESKSQYLRDHSTGATIPHLNKNILLDLQLELLGIEEQENIICILNTIKRLITKRKLQLDELNLLVKSRFNEMFGDPLNNNKKFAVKAGQQCFKFSSGKFLDKHDRVFEGYPAYGGNGIAWKSRKYLIDNPTIIIGRVGAYCGNVRTTHGKVWISDNAIYIKEFKNSDFNLVFLLELMKVIDFSKFADFSGQPKITQKPLENQKYILPPLALQNEFADFVAQVDKSKVTIIMQEMLPLLNNEQLLALRESLEHHLVDGKKQQKYSNNNLLQLFITAKQVEGCSSKTIRYYQRTIENLFNGIKESVTQLTTDDLRSYLANYQSEKDCSKANLDNIRRILSSFFAWLEQEEYIIKNPIRRIKKIKTEQNVKETYTDEHLEIMRDNCENLRDLAIIDLLASTGMRVGELVQLNRSDIDFENRECVVFGKGKKERPVYFDARTKIHLRNYLNDRKDSHPALFVTLVGKAQRLGIAGVEIRLRKLGDKLGIQKVHPHKFRRTLATKAIDKGMPIEQVQKLLGHSKIDTTLAYAMVNQNNVKHSHQKFIS
ncbi:type I restriction-modification enzyme 1, S subunit [Streptococcus pneumoniae]|nr:type I restriction-modification enzyme 1, S subunit [Streptococcus pneumoniae]VMS20825.1 type I restriction-modification enzyme 1, S subunit [Streptococcus pneumoniae]VOP21914.1 type I restriction-modification enzyme 1, S subunit [Streptococcus pneumoniae]VOP29472.1 type I restriction-modification enzyme 1, S subunit [Streptococcus pneumoniae]VQS76404.1 type I restriction-modification enzyme 1, S subunit [Streptococcus pneumoniae]